MVCLRNNEFSLCGLSSSSLALQTLGLRRQTKAAAKRSAMV